MEPAPPRRRRHWTVDAGLGGGVALLTIALAHAALPTPKLAPPPPAAPAARLTAQAAPAAPPPVLIAFAEPLPGGEVVSPFGLRQLPWEGGGRLHAGVDIRGESGDPVALAADGVVTEAGQDGGYGRYVIVRHAEGLSSLYAHLGKIAPDVKPGLALKAGAVVGEVGSSGSSTGPHLHFEIRDRRDRPMNPTLFLGRAFADASDLPLSKAHRFGRQVRVAQVSYIPPAKRALMAERVAKAAAADAASVGIDAAATERIDGLSNVTKGPDGRPRAKLSL